MYEKRNLLLDWSPLPLFTTVCLIEIPLVVVQEFSILETFCQKDKGGRETRKLFVSGIKKEL